MKVGIIFFGEIEWTEDQLFKEFEKRSIKVDFLDAQNIEDVDFQDYALVLNRVYASIANDSDFGFDDFLKHLSRLESKGVNIVNSSLASSCDYSKYKSSKMMSKGGVLNPKTIEVSNADEIKKASEHLGFPMIFKPDTGGRGRSLKKINSLRDVNDSLFSKTGSSSDRFIVQEMVGSIDSVDYRVFVYDGKVLFSNTRTLVDGWLGSRSSGSKVEVLENNPPGLNRVCVDATKSIGAKFNSLDVVRSSEGFSVIENNPTPNFNQSYVDFFGFNPVEKLVEELLKDHSELKKPNFDY